MSNLILTCAIDINFCDVTKTETDHWLRLVLKKLKIISIEGSVAIISNFNMNHGQSIKKNVFIERKI